MSPVFIRGKRIGALEQQEAKLKAEGVNNTSEQAAGSGAQHAAVENSEAAPERQSAVRIRSELERARSRRAGQRELKSRRRELRLTPSADDLITCAMEVSGLTAGDLAY